MPRNYRRYAAPECPCPARFRVSEDGSRQEKIKRFISTGPDDAMQPATSVAKTSWQRKAAHHTEQPTDHDPEVFHLLKIRYPETFARVSRSLLVFSYVWSLVRRRIIMLEPILGTLSIWWLVVYANILLLLSPLVLLMIVFLPNFPILLLRRICYIPIESIWNQSISHRIIAASHL